MKTFDYADFMLESVATECTVDGGIKDNKYFWYFSLCKPAKGTETARQPLLSNIKL